MPTTNLDTTNDSAVALSKNGRIVVQLWDQPMTCAKALRLAAWIVALADENEEFEALLDKVRNP